MLKDLKQLSLNATYTVDNSFDSDRFIKLRIRVQHDDKNPNGSSFTLENMQKAQNTIKNIPILAAVVVDKDGNPQFGAHDMHIEEDKFNEGAYRLIYDESPIGVVPETNNYEILEYDGRNYVYVDAYLWVGYMNYAQDIVERDKDIKVSMEISVLEYTYDSKTDIYDITDYKYNGITLLGNNYGTGMIDAKATTESFSKSGKEKLFNYMAELKNEIIKKSSLNSYNISSYWIDKEQARKLVEKTDEIFKKLGFECIEWCVDGKEYEVTGVINKKINVEASNSWGFDIYDEDTITIKTCDIDYLDKASIYLSSVELLMKSKKDSVQNFSLRLKEDISSFNNKTNTKFSKEKEERNLDEKKELISKYNLTIEQLDFNIDEISLEDLETKLKEFVEANKEPEKESKLGFSATYNQKREALRNALDSEVIRDSDGNVIEETYYWVVDASDEFCFVEKSHWNANGDYESKYGRFTYNFDESTMTATITSEFEEMFLIWLTAEQKAEIDSMNANYNQMKSEFDEYKNTYKTAETEVETLRNFQSQRLEQDRKEAEAAIFSEFDEELADIDEYKAIKDNSSKYELETLKEKCFAILGKSKRTFSFSKKSEKSSVILGVDRVSTEDDPYGGLIKSVNK
jgi:hypothetical protein